ncbi:condensation domain-containing protein [Nocardioides sp. InS609-2]|uniref:condensation domain-containing protein n=1 Tax=Nocardioides sp. InS609-2 TaxID=2760705 RepID=UPI0020BD49AA|nr:condensation domain-containing protein [Nocardioides sp. InS609-2]
MNHSLVPDAPLSFAQARIWLLTQITGPDSQYNVPLILRFPGAVEAPALGAALRDVVTRHEILRTSYADVGGRPHLSVWETDALPQLLTVETCPEDRLRDRVREVSQHHFELVDQLPLHAWLLSGEDGAGAVLVVVIHHIAVDEGSLVPLLGDLGTAYVARRAGSAPAWQPMLLQYCDYAVRQREFLGNVHDPGSLAARQLDHWVKQLTALPEEIPLPMDRPRPAAPDTRGATVVVPVPGEMRERIMKLARAERVAPFTLVKAALGAFLSGRGAGDDLPLIGFVTGRFDGDLDGMVGFFVNTLVFRVDASGAPSFRELVSRTRRVDIDAYSHQDIPFEEVVRALNPSRSSQRHPLAQVAISYVTPETYTLPGTEARVEIGQDLRVKFDLQLDIVDIQGAGADPAQGMFIEWVYAVALFDEETVSSMAHDFRGFLEALLRDPDRQVGLDDSAYAEMR